MIQLKILALQEEKPNSGIHQKLNIQIHFPLYAFSEVVTKMIKPVF